MRKTEEILMKIMIWIILVGGSYLVYLDKIDGIYFNKVIEFTNGIDPLALETVKKDYKRGEMVQAYTAVCKTRNAIGMTKWTLYNEKLVIFADGETRNLPIGCYPNGTGKIIFDIKPVPLDAAYGKHVFGGTSVNTLPDGRTRTYDLKTLPFNVIE